MGLRPLSFTMKNNWNNSGSKYAMREMSASRELLPTGIYKFQMSMTGPYLDRLENTFEFPYKVYDVEHKLIETAYKTYVAGDKNLGILLNGLKGTGKSVTAKLLCNRFNIPVIIVAFHTDALCDFINEIQQDVVIFIDEFEKIYSNSNSSGDNAANMGSLLSVMDGALTNGYKKVFVLTTNQLSINENLLQRPGRIRYLKSYGNVSTEVVQLVMDDKLVHKQFAADIIDFIARLEIVTMDIINAIIEEVNIHNVPPAEFKAIFNVKEKPDRYNVNMLTTDPNFPDVPLGKSTVYRRNTTFVISGKETDDRRTVYVGGYDVGELKEKIDSETFVVTDTKYDEHDNPVFTDIVYQAIPIADYSYNYRALMM